MNIFFTIMLSSAHSCNYIIDRCMKLLYVYIILYIIYIYIYIYYGFAEYVWPGELRPVHLNFTGGLAVGQDQHDIPPYNTYNI